MRRNRKARRQALRMETLVGPGTEMEGSLQSNADLRIDGSFKGTIESQGSVTIGESAVARSNITANEVIVAGMVYGDIAAETKLTITPTGKMFGNVVASSLIVMEGGQLNGVSRMEDQTNSAAQESSELSVLPVKHSDVG
ncbi:polymer-forming cytoskeletal protein [Paenibacillus cisolokensis]|uniref:bactofilin family protein n=1 Tax=Paenibacillus cisolokensis TaxID=1658519 RepID=UPI003D266F33